MVCYLLLQKIPDWFSAIACHSCAIKKIDYEPTFISDDQAGTPEQMHARSPVAKVSSTRLRSGRVAALLTDKANQRKNQSYQHELQESPVGPNDRFSVFAPPSEVPTDARSTLQDKGNVVQILARSANKNASINDAVAAPSVRFQRVARQMELKRKERTTLALADDHVAPERPPGLFPFSLSDDVTKCESTSKMPLIPGGDIGPPPGLASFQPIRSNDSQELSGKHQSVPYNIDKKLQGNVEDPLALFPCACETADQHEVDARRSDFNTQAVAGRMQVRDSGSNRVGYDSSNTRPLDAPDRRIQQTALYDDAVEHVAPLTCSPPTLGLTSPVRLPPGLTRRSEDVMHIATLVSERLPSVSPIFQLPSPTKVDGMPQYIDPRTINCVPPGLGAMHGTPYHGSIYACP